MLAGIRRAAPATALIVCVGSFALPRSTASAPPPPPAAPRATLTVSSTAPITVVVGDTVDLTATVKTNAGWLFSPPMSTGLTVTLPGLSYVCDSGCSLTAVDLVSAIPTSGMCFDWLRCNFGPVGPNSTSSATIRLRGKTPGAYQFALTATSGNSVSIPFTVAPRVGDLAAAPLPPVRRLLVGRVIVRTVQIQNHGPNSVSDATLIVGSPGGVVVRATSADGTCTAVPIRCALEELEPGQSATVQLKVISLRKGRISIPIGVASKAAGDNQTSNNAFRLLVNMVSPVKPKP